MARTEAGCQNWRQMARTVIDDQSARTGAMGSIATIKVDTLNVVVIPADLR